MPKPTNYVVQTFTENNGRLIADAPTTFFIRTLAESHAELMATMKVGVLAWGNDLGSGRTIIFRAGRLPKGMSEV